MAGRRALHEAHRDTATVAVLFRKLERRSIIMALFMDVHTMGGPVGLSDVEQAHAADLRTQERYGVSYLRYWVDEGQGKIFCLVEAPDADAAESVHREAHGLVADAIFPVAEGS
jgi:hypothetical protein